MAILQRTPANLVPACSVCPSTWQQQKDGGQTSSQPCARAGKSKGLRHAGQGQVPGLGKVPGKTRRWSELTEVGGTLSGPLLQEALLAPKLGEASLRLSLSVSDSFTCSPMWHENS